jgi:hypothetical protein
MYPTEPEINAVPLKYNAINPSSRMGGNITRKKIPSEIARIIRMPITKRVGMGV